MASYRRRVLVLFGHPAFQKSRVNRAMLGRARELPGVTVHDLYDAYPDMVIDVRREQTLLLSHDAIVLQHPFYWYNTPAIFKEWQDLVLTHGFAFGDGSKLAGKLWLQALTAGVSENDYKRGGGSHFTVTELLAPLEQTARFCGMRFLEPFRVHASTAITTTAGLKQVEDRYVARLTEIRDTAEVF